MASRMSDKEKETILRLRKDGLTYREIGEMLDRGRHTVSFVCNPEIEKSKRAYRVKYRAENRERLRERDKKFRAENIERLRERGRKYHADNVEKERARNRKYAQSPKGRENSSARSKKWRIKNGEEIRAQSRKYYAEHPELMKAKQTRYKSKQSAEWHEEQKEKCRQYRVNNLEKVRTREVAYRAKHPEKVRAQQRKFKQSLKGRIDDRSRQHRRLELMKHGDGFTFEDFELLWVKQQGECAYCGRLTTRDKAACREGSYCNIEHIVPLSMGGLHEPSNIVLACAKCNSKKGTAIWEPQLIEALA